MAKTPHTLRRLLAIGAAIAVVSYALCGAASAHAEAYFDNYGLVPNSPTVDLGVQPLGYPSGLISAVMRHDRILTKALAT